MPGNFPKVGGLHSYKVLGDMQYSLMLVSTVKSKMPSFGCMCLVFPHRSLFEPLVSTARPLQRHQLPVPGSCHCQGHRTYSAARALHGAPGNSVTGSQIHYLYHTIMSPTLLCSLQEGEETGVNYKRPLSLNSTNLGKIRGKVGINRSQGPLSGNPQTKLLFPSF